MHLLVSSLLTILGVALTASVARADDAAIAREIDAALLRVADRGSLPFREIRRPARTRYELGAVVDVRSADARGLPVLAVTPGGAAERIGLRRGDRLIRINGVTLAAASQPALAYRRALSTEEGRMRLDVLRGGKATVLSGTADKIVLPAYTLALGGTSAAADSNAGCGRISTFDAMPRGARRFPVVVIAVDGRTPPSRDEILRLPAGRHRLLLAERIDADRFSVVQLKQRDLQGTKAYKSLELDVAPDTTYLLAAEMVKPPALRIAGGAYWTPVIHGTSKVACR
jgi:hypothetical protein